jgi:tetratricopeptide (TPR) repeat protein
MKGTVRVALATVCLVGINSGAWATASAQTPAGDCSQEQISQAVWEAIPNFPLLAESGQSQTLPLQSEIWNGSYHLESSTGIIEVPHWVGADAPPPEVPDEPRITFLAEWHIAFAYAGFFDAGEISGNYQRARDELESCGESGREEGVFGPYSCLGVWTQAGTEDPNWSSEPYFGRAQAYIGTPCAEVQVTVTIKAFAPIGHGARNKPAVLEAINQSCKAHASDITKRLQEAVAKASANLEFPAASAAPGEQPKVAEAPIAAALGAAKPDAGQPVKETPTASTPTVDTPAAEKVTPAAETPTVETLTPATPKVEAPATKARPVDVPPLPPAAQPQEGALAEAEPRAEETGTETEQVIINQINELDIPEEVRQQMLEEIMAGMDEGAVAQGDGEPPAEILEAWESGVWDEDDTLDDRLIPGYELLSLEKFSEAETFFREYLSVDPNNLNAHLALGDALMLQEKVAEAEVAYRRAVEIEPDDPEFQTLLAESLIEQGKWDEAEQCYRNAIRLEPDNPAHYADLAWILSELGRIDEAEAALRKAEELAD